MEIDVLRRDDLPFPTSLLEFQRLFPDDAVCARYLEKARWGDGFVCPYCHKARDPFRFTKRPAVLRCRKCRRDTGLTVGTVIHYTDLLEMADRLVFLRVLLKEVAKKHGMFITFMPKPTVGDWRSGAHINFSLQHVDRPGENLFEDGSGWAEASRHAVGGLMAHAEAITAITCPTVDSYNGLVPRVGGFEGGTVTWAPTNITYGFNNRSAQFRLPQSRYCIENRAADMTMNVYLALAMTLSASLEGIEKRIEPGAPTDRDLYAMTDDEFMELGIRRLPRNLMIAMEALKGDALAERIMGSAMRNSYLAYKNDEWERYHQAVTDWEVQEYLRLY